MHHKNIHKKLVEYLENELDQKERAEVAAHLSECKLCNQELVQLKKVFTILDKETLFEPTEQFWINYLPTLRKKIEAARKSSISEFWATILRPVPTTAVLIVLVICLIFLGEDIRKPALPPEFEWGYTVPITSSVDLKNELIDLVIDCETQQKIITELVPEHIDWQLAATVSELEKSGLLSTYSLDYVEIFIGLADNKTTSELEICADFILREQIYTKSSYQLIYELTPIETEMLVSQLKQITING